MSRYKVTLTSNTIYKEIELASDMQQVKVGTGVDCDVRLRKELFFGQIELVFAKNGDSWAVSCSDNMYLTVGDIRKLMTKKLVHGDVLEIKYQESDNLVFTLEFLIRLFLAKIPKALSSIFRILLTVYISTEKKQRARLLLKMVIFSLLRTIFSISKIVKSGRRFVQR